MYRAHAYAASALLALAALTGSAIPAFAQVKISMETSKP
jgi:hypothetical protein